MNYSISVHMLALQIAILCLCQITYTEKIIIPAYLWKYFKISTTLIASLKWSSGILMRNFFWNGNQHKEMNRGNMDRREELVELEKNQ